MVADFRPEPSSIPDEPGVYRFRDAEGRVIYVGKAKSLRGRLGSYFADPRGLHSRTRSMVEAAASVDWIVVASEVEALQLEYSWIKEYDPRFNVRFRDDKSYPYLAVTLGEVFPRALVTRGAKRAGTRYFGPYAHAWAIRASLDLLLRVFPVRTCSSGVFDRARRSGRPCLLADIGKCSAPCVGRVSEAEHREIALELCGFLGGQAKPVQRRLRDAMLDASAAQDFERAARLRDDLQALDRALERNTVVFDESVDADVIGIALDELEAAFEVFHVRGGRIRGERGYVVERVDDASPEELVGGLLVALAQDADEVPAEILVPAEPEPGVVALLAQRRGSGVNVRVPQRGAKRSLAETVSRNAQQRLDLHKARRTGDLTARSRALQDLQDGLGLSSAPLRIETIDVSHLAGQDVVGSLVVFEDGLVRPGEKRTFALTATDDTSAIFEIVSRRFRPSTSEEEVTERRRAFAYPPQLLVVDGGRPQADAAARALRERGIHDLPVVGLAKRLEEVWLPGRPDPIILPRTSEGLYLLQRMRDEAHRAAITFQRKRSRRRARGSALEEIPGLGPARIKALLARFGSVARMRQSSVDDIAQVPGIGPKTAAAIMAVLGASTDEMLDPEPGEGE
ncbi:MAG: excinuclease ABC subunit UvrC [Actinomycetales bacterium]|nr:excinuclease ABC subunit UvrC [Actinomycetales bacterium]